MSTVHTVVEGDCLSSIARHYGFFPGTLWNHAQNAELRRKRGNPNVLAPGDQVFIPTARVKKFERPTGARHVFRVRNVPAKLRLQLMDDDEVLANLPYVLAIDGGGALRGTTSGEGRIEVTIPPEARAGKLTVGEGEDAVSYDLRLGHLDPVETPNGVRSRLENLGYHGPDLAHMLRRFQLDHGLRESGEPDEATCAELVTTHGS